MRTSFVTLLAILSLGASSPNAANNYYERQLVRIQTSEGMGTGFYLRYGNRTYILTCQHVCSTPKDGLITFLDYNDKKIIAKKLRGNIALDLCLIDSDNKQGLRLAQATYCREQVHMSGFANGGYSTLSVDARLCDRVFENYVIPGHSGSPVVDSLNGVVGVAMGRELDNSIGYVVTLDEIKIFMEKKK